MSLTHKWESRDRLKKRGVTLQNLEEQTEQSVVSDINNAVSAFLYCDKYSSNIAADRSLKAISELCSSALGSVEPDYRDNNVFHLSHTFNAIIASKRNLLKCYDCGTNARAAFLRLCQVARGIPLELIPLTDAEQKRMSEEYWLNVTTPLEEIKKCYQMMINVPKDTVFIMSVGVQDFGHIWIVEKRFIKGKPRFHHYQSALRSHMLIDFLEAMDYPKNPSKSLDIDEFMSNIGYLMCIKGRAWTSEENELFESLFGFLPFPITNPRPGFCFTHVTY